MNEPSITNPVKKYQSEPLRIIGQLFDYYRGRERALINLLYQYGASTNEIANALNIDPALISRNYPRGTK